MSARRKTPWQVRRGGRRYGDPARKGAWVVVLQSTPAGPTAVDPKPTGKPDDARINIEQEQELRYWSEKFRVSRAELQSAVAKAGPLVKNVREYLQHRS